MILAPNLSGGFSDAVGRGRGHLKVCLGLEDQLLILLTWLLAGSLVPPHWALYWVLSVLTTV